MTQRREFIKALGRGFILTGLAGISTALLLRNKDPEAEQCEFDFICRNCGRKKSCSLPEAMEFRDRHL